MELFLLILFIVVGRFAYLEHKLYKLRLEYVGLRIKALKEDIDNEPMDEDRRLLMCQCSKCEFGDSSPIGVICSLDKPQFNDDGNCKDFVER